MQESNGRGLVKSFAKVLVVVCKCYVYFVLWYLIYICNVSTTVQKIFVAESVGNTIQTTRGLILLSNTTVVITNIKLLGTDLPRRMLSVPWPTMLAYYGWFGATSFWSPRGRFSIKTPPYHYRYSGDDTIWLYISIRNLILSRSLG